jgi:ParB-like chromosome segregation protein Spo0J
MMNKQLNLFDEQPVEKTGIDTFVYYIVEAIRVMDRDAAIEAINQVKVKLHEVSPFASEPVDCVLWVKNDSVVANDYNPNSVAPPEMELLEVSIMNDGYTQPIVTWPRAGTREVVDGFHRSRVGKESAVVSKRVNGYLPVVTIRKEQQEKNDRIASTIRHNRARGKHQVDAMSEIVMELKNRNWTNQRIARELGMDEDEILRLCQITGLSHLFTDKDFSRAWEAVDAIPTDDFEPLTDNISDAESGVRTINTDDPNRVFHTFDKWECVKAGFYATTKDGWSREQCEQAYFDLLTDSGQFESAARSVTKDWPMSCEHYLTNSAMNRLAWIGQASVCLKYGVPSQFASGWNLLSEDQKKTANAVALKVLNEWLASREIGMLDFEQAAAIGRQVEIY